MYAIRSYYAFLCGIMAAELGINVKQAKRAGLLHDIGKAVDHEIEGSHAVIGADLARKYGEAPKIVHALAAHHEDEKPETILAVLVQAADALSGARPGARREMLETYVKRLDDLERIGTSFRITSYNVCYTKLLRNRRNLERLGQLRQELRGRATLLGSREVEGAQEEERLRSEIERQRIEIELLLRRREEEQGRFEKIRERFEAGSREIEAQEELLKGLRNRLHQVREGHRNNFV